MSYIKTALITTGVCAAAVLGYAAYFDYRRRTDASFRKNIKKAKKEHEAKKTAEAKAQEDKMVQMLTEALTLVKNTPYPTEVEEREKFFIDNLQKGEVLARQGADQLIEAAACIFKSVKVYPNQVDLLMVLQKSLPQDLMGLVYAMLSTEVQIQQMMMESQD